MEALHCSGFLSCAQLHPGAAWAAPALPGLQLHDLAEMIVGKTERADGQAQRALQAEQFAALLKRQRQRLFATKSVCLGDEVGLMHVGLRSVIQAYKRR